MHERETLGELEAEIIGFILSYIWTKAVLHAFAGSYISGGHYPDLQALRYGFLGYNCAVLLVAVLLERCVFLHPRFRPW